jgi:CBS domain-containing protein
MTVHDVMTRGPECTRPNDTIASVASRMRDLGVGSLPVCGDSDKLVGMITDRDITVRATSRACDPSTTCVRDVMTPGIVCCREDDDLAEAVRMMEEKQIRRLVVLNGNNRLVGILALGDLAVKSGDDELSAEALHEVSEPARPNRIFQRH